MTRNLLVSREYMRQIKSFLHELQGLNPQPLPYSLVTQLGMAKLNCEDSIYFLDKALNENSP